MYRFSPLRHAVLCKTKKSSIIYSFVLPTGLTFNDGRDAPRKLKNNLAHHINDESSKITNKKWCRKLKFY